MPARPCRKNLLEGKAASESEQGPGRAVSCFWSLGSAWLSSQSTPVMDQLWTITLSPLMLMSSQL